MNSRLLFFHISKLVFSCTLCNVSVTCLEYAFFFSWVDCLFVGLTLHTIMLQNSVKEKIVSISSKREGVHGTP